MTADWPKGLPRVELADVAIEAGSLTEAWQAIATTCLAPAVLVTTGSPSEAGSFRYRAVRCVIADVFEALAQTYGIDWNQDQMTGTVWFQPKGLPRTSLLDGRIAVTGEQLGLPMQTGVLEPLGAVGIGVKTWGTLFENTFNYPVDVAAGRFSVRDVLNLCCAANLTKTFLIQLQRARPLVTAVNLSPDSCDVVPAGALHLWQSEFGGAASTPTPAALLAALADRDPARRQTARNYLEATIDQAPIDAWVSGSAASTVQTLWACIAVTSILVRSEQATHLAAIATMEQLATDEFLASCEPGLGLIIGLDLARLMKSDRALAAAANRQPAADQLAAVASDACRIAALSSYAREALLRHPGLLAALPPLADAVRAKNPGKLEFSLLT